MGVVLTNHGVPHDGSKTKLWPVIVFGDILNSDDNVIGAARSSLFVAEETKLTNVHDIF